MGCGASTANLPERGESPTPSPLKNKPGAALATTDFTDVDANDDGAITVAELASALEQHGEEPTAALERAHSLLAEFDADGNGVLSEEEYAVLHACVAHSSRLADITDTDCLGAPEDVAERDPIKLSAERIFSRAEEVAATMPKAEPVYLVAVDHDGNEIGSYGTEKASAFFLKAARGKVRSLLKTKDYGSVATGGVSGRVSLAALSSGATKEYPVVGCLMISYTTPTGSQGVGFFSVAGCKSVGDDLFIGREALLKAGLQETKAGSNVFRFGTATERRASAAKYAAPGSGEEA